MELEILRHIQSISNPFFDFLFQLITICGEQIVLIVIISIIYYPLFHLTSYQYKKRELNSL